MYELNYIQLSCVFDYKRNIITYLLLNTWNIWSYRGNVHFYGYVFISLANRFYWWRLKADAASVHANVYRAIMSFLFIVCVCVTLTDENQKQEIFRLRFFPLCCCVNGNSSFCQYLRVSETTTKFLSLSPHSKSSVSLTIFTSLKKKKRKHAHILHCSNKGGKMRRTILSADRHSFLLFCFFTHCLIRVF